MKTSVIISVFLLSLQSFFGQNISRKGSFGVSFYQTIPDSLVQKLNYKEGVIVRAIIPNSSAQSIGIKPNDIVLKINDILIEDSKKFISIAKKLRENELLNVSIIRNNKTIALKGKVIAKPKETSTTAQVVYGEFAYKNGFVRTIYKTLKDKKPLGTIYFLQGLPCYSMDNFQELDKTKQAIDAMVDRGFAVYRMEKGDMGDNVNMPNCDTMGFDEELEMYEAGYTHLLTLKEVDANKIFLFGHSMGGITAPLLAEKFQPKGVVVYGTGFKPWLEYLMDAFLIQPQYYGQDLAKLRAALEVFKPHVYDYFYGNKSFDEVCKNPIGLEAMKNLLGYNPETKLGASGRSPNFFKEINQYNLAEAWGNYKNDVLAIYGECDTAAIHPDDHINIVNYINKKRPGKATFWLAPATSHMFEEIGSMNEFIKCQYKPKEFNTFAATRFNSKVFDYTCDWMKKML